jgi:hypothetical protein
MLLKWKIRGKNRNFLMQKKNNDDSLNLNESKEKYSIFIG